MKKIVYFREVVICHCMITPYSYVESVETSVKIKRLCTNHKIMLHGKNVCNTFLNKFRYQDQFETHTQRQTEENPLFLPSVVRGFLFFSN